MNKVNSNNLEVHERNGGSSASRSSEGDRNHDDNSIQQIRQHLVDDWKILNSIPDLLIRANAFCAQEHNWSEQKIVDFVQPEELKVQQNSLKQKHRKKEFKKS